MTVYAFPPAAHVDADNLPGQTFAWSQVFVAIDLTGYTATMTIDGIAANLPCTVSVVQIGANTSSQITLTSVLGASTSTWLPGVYPYRVTLTAPDATTSVAAYGSLLELTPRAGSVYGTVGPQGPPGLQGPAGLRARGAYSSLIAYVLNDVVTSGGSTYRAIGNTTNNAPPNVTFWELLASGTSPGGDLTGTSTAQIVSKFQGVTLNAAVATPSDQYVITFDAASNSYTPKPIRLYDPLNYGGQYSRTYDPVIAKKNIIALNRIGAAIKSSPAVSGYVQITDTLPILDTWQVDYPLVTETLGCGWGGAIGPSQIMAPAGVEAIVLTGSAFGSLVEELAITASGCFVPQLWQSLHPYSRNDIVRCPSNNKYVFRCVVAGTSGASLPAFTAPDAITPRRFSYGMQCVVGDYIFPSRNSGLYGIRLLQVTSAFGSTTAGTAGRLSEVSEPAYDTALAGTTWTSGDLVLTVVDFTSLTRGSEYAPIWNIPDGTAKWIAEPISGVVCHTTAHLDRLRIEKFSCLAIEVYSQLYGPPLAVANCNGTSISRIWITNCGAGIYEAGFNSNSNTVRDVYLFQVGIDPNNNQQMPGQGGVGIEDNTLIGLDVNTFLCQTTTGPSYISTTLGVSKFQHCYTDGSYQPSLFRHSAIIEGGNCVGGASIDATCVIVGPDNRGGALGLQWPSDRYGDYPLYANVVVGSGRDLYAVTSSRDRNGSDYTAYHADDFYQGMWFRSNQQGNTPFRYLTGFSSNRSPLGRGNEWNINGQFRGVTPRWNGFDPSTATDNKVRFGKRVVGDRWVSNPTPNPGQFINQITTTAGSIGSFTWATNAPVTCYGTDTGAAATTVLGGNGFQYTCVKSGSTGAGAPPNWAGFTTIGPNAQAWIPNQKVWPGDLFRPTNDSLFYFKVTPPPQWTANTPVKCGSFISPVTANSTSYDVFLVDPPSYVPTSGAMVGDIFQPTQAKRDAATRLAQLCTAIVDRGTPNSFPGAQGLTGAEPTTWPTTAGASTTIIYYGDVNYQTTWVTTQLTTGATEPTAWANALMCQIDGGNDYSGGVVGTKDNNCYWVPREFITGTTEPTWNTSVVGALTTDAGGVTVPQPTAVPFTLSYVGPIPAGSLITTDNTTRWMCTDTVPVYAATEQVVVPGTLTKTGAGTVSLTVYEAHYQAIKCTAATTLAFGTNHYDGNMYCVTNAAGLPLAVTPGTVSIPSGSTYVLKSDGTNLIAPNIATPVTPVLPTGLSGLYVWLRSDTGVTQAGTVSTWADQSGNGNSFGQATAGQRPAFNASDITYNGLPSIAFTGTATNVLTNASLTLGPFTKFIVMRQTIGGYVFNFGAFDYSYGPDPGGLYVQRAGVTSAYNAGTNWSVTTAPKVFVHRFDGTHVGHTLRINGSQQAMTTYAGNSGDPGVSTVTTSMGLFGSPAGVNCSTGTCAEVIIYNRALTTAEIQRVELYLQNRYMAY